MTRIYSYIGRIAATEGSDVKQAYIHDSIIKNIPDPVDAQDPVSLRYLQRVIQQNMLTANSISIRDTTWVDVPETNVPWFGNYTLSINAVVEHSPNAQWQIARSSAQEQGVITQGVFSPTNADCVLQIRWLPQTLLQIRKTTNDFNGTYYLRVT